MVNGQFVNHGKRPTCEYISYIVIVIVYQDYSHLYMYSYA